MPSSPGTANKLVTPYSAPQNLHPIHLTLAMITVPCIFIWPGLQFLPKAKRPRLESDNIHGQVQANHIQPHIPSLPNWSSSQEITRGVSKTAHQIRDTPPKYSRLQWRWNVARGGRFLSFHMWYWILGDAISYELELLLWVIILIQLPEVVLDKPSYLLHTG